MPIEKYAVTRAVNDLLRCSLRPHSAITSSTKDAGNTLVSNPTDTTSDNRRSETGFTHPLRGTPHHNSNFTN
ncbi:hypothetical protein RW1_011_02100 [Rhodococcus wratislaviensis NBRC 100605]|uniref:Uncharacterized protein n=1 Tax=Rhodococcus wratislaviensis NBRC 100605 TaxID=1219028 RepID=X0Q1Q4_RHOWR|nr:hypothetical protein RW1_011_02100 [Rhodococcus wratislaviensis NBRC 100605]